MKATRQDSIIKAIEPLITAIGATFVEVDAVKPSDVPIEVDGEVVVGVRLPALHGALERMIDSVEREL
ncbi:MAG: transcriptional regulator, partial [Ilumatobacteraceae bacterium]